MNPETAKRYPKNWSEISKGIKKIRGAVCEECYNPKTFNNVLTVHHIDGCPENNAPDNLIVLCQVCHLRTQTQGKSLWKYMKQYQLMLFPQ